MGAWIEILHQISVHEFFHVAPLVGAWIEIMITWVDLEWVRSLPSWERGLKLSIVISHTSLQGVAPLVGAWIEILVTRS